MSRPGLLWLAALACVAAAFSAGFSFGAREATERAARAENARAARDDARDRLRTLAAGMADLGCEADGIAATIIARRRAGLPPYRPRLR